MNLQSQLPTQMAKSLDNEKAIFIIDSTRTMSIKSAIRIALFFLLLLPIPLHYILVIIFKNYKANLFHNFHQITNSNTFQLLDSSLFSGVNMVLLIIPSIFLLLFLFLLYVGLREFISPTQTIWVGTSQKLMVMKNKNKIKAYPWDDFWGIVSDSGNNTKGNITLWYTPNKPLIINKHEPRILTIFETQNAIDISNICRQHIEIAFTKKYKSIHSLEA